MNRNGFTLLEVLVASVLMGMLVTILTVIFNQSAIAWRTGKAGVADMSVYLYQCTALRVYKRPYRNSPCHNLTVAFQLIAT